MESDEKAHDIDINIFFPGQKIDATTKKGNKALDLKSVLMEILIFHAGVIDTILLINRVE